VRTQVVAFFLSIGIASLMTPVVLRLSKRLGFYDVPDGERKIHEDPIPRLGGIAIAAGFLAPLVGLLFYTNNYSHQLKDEELRLLSFFLGFLMIFGLGLYDDLKGVGAWPKLTVQILVGVVLWYGGLSFSGMKIFGFNIDMGAFSLPVTVIWVAAVVNAMNLIDGLDGLAGGVAFFASVSLFTIAWLDGFPILALFGACLAGASLGFLLYNFEPAMIFMGDSGSMTIGYVFASAALWDWGKRATAMALILPIIALGLPIFDTVFAFMRRALSGRSPFSSDRGHIHHRLLDSGLSHRSSVLILYLVCALLTASVIAIRMTEDPTWGAVVLALAVFIFAGGRAMIRRNRRGLQRRQEALAAARLKAEAKAQAEANATPPNDDLPPSADGVGQQGGVVVPLRRVR